MTHKEIAERLRDMLGGDHLSVAQLEAAIERAINFADALDPPRPEPGAMVWCVTDNCGEPERLFVREADADAYNHEQYRGGRDVIAMRLPARILADDEVAVKVPPLRQWPERGEYLDVVITGNMASPRHVNRLITRAEAEAREAGR